MFLYELDFGFKFVKIVYHNLLLFEVKHFVVLHLKLGNLSTDFVD